MTTYQDYPQRSDQNLFLQHLEHCSPHLLSQMELVPLPIGKLLQESGISPRHVYFPTTCVCSLLCGMKNGSVAEVAVIGNEGLVGITHIVGGDISPIQAIVQSTGYAYRLRSHALRHEYQSNPELQALLMKYMHLLVSQMAQTAVCNRHHTLDQQLCRWLLNCLDRLPSNELLITQEFIAHMLGVRREGVTAAAGKLQKAGAIKYRRGRISIVDRFALEANSCECYELVRKEQLRVLPPKTTTVKTPVYAKDTSTSTSNEWEQGLINAQPLHAAPKNSDFIGERA